LHGMMGARWERRVPQTEAENESQRPHQKDIDQDEGKRIAGFTSVGQKKVRFLRAEFGYGGGLFRFGPYLNLSDLDGSMLALFVNRTLSEKVKAIHIYGNEYKLGEYDHGQFRAGAHPNFKPDLLFTPEELSDEWVRIMRDTGPFRIQFSEMTPVRLFEPVEATNSLAKPKVPAKPGD
jgi:hypothetical protein